MTLNITSLSARLAANPDGPLLLDNVSLDVLPGQVHAIMGPNGAGKSTLAKILAGHPAYTVTNGSVQLAGEDLLTQEPHARVHAGLFVGFQYPVEVPGVNNGEFLRLAYNAREKARGRPEVSIKDWPPMLEKFIQIAESPSDFAERGLNTGLSGGQRKRNEILQMVVLDPKVAVLDETDSGLDIDAIKAVGRSITNWRRADRSVILITHFQRLLELVVPDRVHVLVHGRLVASGGPELAQDLEKHGYARWGVHAP